MFLAFSRHRPQHISINPRTPNHIQLGRPPLRMPDPWPSTGVQQHLFKFLFALELPLATVPSPTLFVPRSTWKAAEE